jgi:DNA-binding NarL/FixJ family response regulator
VPHTSATTQLPDSSIRPLIVEGHEATRLGTALVLRRQPWVARCLLAANIQEAVAMAARHRPEVALLDISNVGPFVPSATAQLSDTHPGIAIVLTSRCRVAAPGPEALGARAFLPAGTSAREIVAAVRAAVLSVEYRPAPSTDEPVAHLTDRERELLLLISHGATNREIADHLHLGPDSIKKSASALYRKLGVRNRTEAAQKAAHLLGFVSTAPGERDHSPFGPRRPN